VSARPGQKECSEKIERLSPEDFDALVLRRVTARRQQAAWRVSEIRTQASERAAAVLDWPPGRP
jgi:hypothetical protein